MRLKESAAARVRQGDRRLHILLKREGRAINHKRVYRSTAKKACRRGSRHPVATGPDAGRPAG
jgi:putative transposase